MGKRKLKIALFHLGFFYSGGGERLVMEQARGLEERGHEVEIWTPFADSSRAFPGELEKFKVKQIFPGLPEWVPSRVFLQLGLTCVLFPLAGGKFRKFDVVVAANQPSPWFGYWIKKVLGKPYVVYLVQPTRLIYPRKIDRECGVRIAGDRVFSPWLIKLVKPAIAAIDKLSVENCDRLLVISEYTRERLRKYYRREARVCYPGVEVMAEKKIVEERFKGDVMLTGHPEPFDSAQGKLAGGSGGELFEKLVCQIPPRASLGRNDREINYLKIRKPYLLVTNRHFPQKRFDYAVRVLSKLVEAGYDLRLVITGKETEYTDKIKGLAEELELMKPRGLRIQETPEVCQPPRFGEDLTSGVVNRVIFTGLVDEAELRKLYAHAAVYLYTSPDEDFGLGILEAMAAGTPVVAWGRGGPREMIVNGKNGYLAESGSEEDFAVKVERLVKSPQLGRGMGRAGWGRVGKEFSPEKHGEILEAALREIY
jgi:glycosyltransferase involved in cell wall biosynthesis